MLILLPTAMAQEQTVMVEQTMTMEKDLPKSGGPAVSSMLLPAVALLVGSGVLAFAVLRRR
jgi:membrane anchored protein